MPSHANGTLPALGSVPNPSTAGAYAAEMRRAISSDDANAPLLDLDGFCRKAGVIAKEGSLRAGEGGIEAMLIPMNGNRFSAVVDTEPSGGWAQISDRLRADVSRHRYRFRLAHETAHTIFYDRTGARPKRRFASSDAEERFCDWFAQALLIPDEVIATRDPTPAEVLRVQSDYDVSLEVCVRAFASVHDETLFALLAARGTRPPMIRPQWISTDQLTARWWAADWLQQALSPGPAREGDREAVIPAGSTQMRCVCRALPQRQQLLIIGRPAPPERTAVRFRR